MTPAGSSPGIEPIVTPIKAPIIIARITLSVETSLKPNMILSISTAHQKYLFKKSEIGMGKNS
ncbi:hypothetical protein GCM10026986_31680 [Nitrincola alkalisediminis]